MKQLTIQSVSDVPPNLILRFCFLFASSLLPLLALYFTVTISSNKCNALVVVRVNFVEQDLEELLQSSIPARIVTKHNDNAVNLKAVKVGTDVTDVLVVLLLAFNVAATCTTTCWEKAAACQLLGVTSSHKAKNWLQQQTRQTWCINKHHLGLCLIAEPISLKSLILNCD